MRLILIMGILSFFTACKDRDTSHGTSTQAAVAIDLTDFQIGSTLIGAPISANDPYYSAFTKADVFKPVGQGLEIGTKDGLLDYGFFTLESFRGSFTRSSQPLTIGLTTTERDIVKIFGEPYWIDRSDGEVILFYEYQGGTVELQFEFPDARNLGFVTLSRYGVLSASEQRTRYGVNKPWPPQ